MSKKNILIVFHGNSCRALLKKILNISNKKIIELEIPTGNPLSVKFGNDAKVKECKYLDSERSKKILFNSIMSKILFLIDHEDYTTMGASSITLNHINIRFRYVN